MEYKAAKAGRDIDLTDLDPGKVEMDLKWWNFKESFINMTKNVKGVNDDPIYYVIHPSRIAGWVINTMFDIRIYQLPYVWAVYQADKKMVWDKILKAAMTTPS